MKNLNKKVKLSEFLILLRHNKDDKSRVTIVKQIGDLGLKNYETYQILENLSISDENPSIRSCAATVLLKLFPEKSEKPIRWIIYNDNSVIVLRTIFRTIEDRGDELSFDLKQLILERCSRALNVNNKEVLFYLDLFELNESQNINSGINLNINFGDFLIGNSILDLKYEGIPIIVKNGYTIALNLSGWMIKKLPNSIRNLEKLKYLDLSENNLTSLPNSIRNLEKLKYLDLSENNLTSLPDFFETLKRLRTIYLSDNNICKIPATLSNIVRDRLTRRFIWEGVSLNDAYILGLLEILTRIRLKKTKNKEIEKELGDMEVATHYSINKNGHVKGLYLYDTKVGFRIRFFPEEICLLTSLEELVFYGGQLNSLPTSIQNLKFLRILNLGMNCLEILPESIKRLKNLEKLDLSYNPIKGHLDIKKFI